MAPAAAAAAAAVAAAQDGAPGPLPITGLMGMKTYKSTEVHLRGLGMHNTPSASKSWPPRSTRAAR